MQRFLIILLIINPLVFLGAEKEGRNTGVARNEQIITLLNKINYNLTRPELIKTYSDSIKKIYLKEKKENSHPIELPRLYLLVKRFVIEKNKLYRGKIFGFFSEMEVKGRFEGTLINLGGNVKLDSTAIIFGDVITLFGKINDQRLTRDFGDNIIQIDPISFAAEESPINSFFNSLIRFLLLTLILILVARFRFITIETSYLNLVASPVKSFIIGVLFFYSTIPIIFLLIVAIVGIPLVPFLLVLYAWCAIIGYLAVIHFIIEYINKHFTNKIPYYVNLIAIIFLFEFWTDLVYLLYEITPIGNLITKRALFWFDKIFLFIIISLGSGSYLIRFRKFYHYLYKAKEKDSLTIGTE